MQLNLVSRCLEAQKLWFTHVKPSRRPSDQTPHTAYGHELMWTFRMLSRQSAMSPLTLQLVIAYPNSNLGFVGARTTAALSFFLRAKNTGRAGERNKETLLLPCSVGASSLTSSLSPSRI